MTSKHGVDLPAIVGGAPVRERLLPYGRQHIDDADVAAVESVLRSDWLTTGPMVPAFEAAFGEYTGAAHSIAIANGTAALHAAVAVLDLAPGDEVIVPVLTFAASANCVRYCGGTVVFADVRPDTLTLDVEHVARLITPCTRAIVTVDYAGLPSDLDAIQELASAHGLHLIEDASHALGATYRGRTIGSIAGLTTFSFHPVKHLTTAEGGMITTGDAALATRLRRFRSHGITTDHRQREQQGSWFYEMEELGFNYRITDIQCALGCAQLKRQPAGVARRREIARRYTDAFADVPELILPAVPGGYDSAWHLYAVRLELEQLRASRADVFHALRAENIGVNVHYIPVPWHPYYQRLGYQRGQWPVAEGAYERLISLPMFPSMTDGDVDDTITAVRRVIGYYRR